MRGLGHGNLKGQLEAVFCLKREDGREGGVLQAGQTATPVCTFSESHSFGVGREQLEITGMCGDRDSDVAAHSVRVWLSESPRMTCSKQYTFWIPGSV